MHDVWLITRSLTGEIASNLNLEQIIKDTNSEIHISPNHRKEVYYEAYVIKKELDELKITSRYVSYEEFANLNLSSMKLPKIAIDCYHTFDLNLHIKNLISLKNHGILVVNDPLTHKICGDKWAQYELLMANQISIPKTIHIQLPITDENIEMVKKEIGFPLVVKPTNGVRGRGVSKCHNEDDLWFECLSMRKLIIPPKTAIAQKWIDHENKGTIRVYMIGGIIVASMQRKSNIKIDFFKSNIKQNSIRMPYEIDINLYNICERVYHAFNKIDLCSIDILHDGDNYMIVDINSPGSSFGMDMALNMNIGHLIAKYIASKI